MLYNTITIAGETYFIDSDDYEKISKYTWRIYKAVGYPMRQFSHGYIDGKQQLTNVFLHRYLMGDPKGMEIDHIDNNPYNIRKSNLRIVTHQQNMFNRSKQKNNKSGYKGVHWSKSKRKWKAAVVLNKKEHFIGYFTDILEAAKARDKKAIELHGEYASLNFEVIS